MPGSRRNQAGRGEGKRRGPRGSGGRKDWRHLGRFGVLAKTGADGAGTGVALPSAKQSRRSCDTRLRRTVTAAGDMSTFMTRPLQGASAWGSKDDGAGARVGQLRRARTIQVSDLRHPDILTSAGENAASMVADQPPSSDSQASRGGALLFLAGGAGGWDGAGAARTESIAERLRRSLALPDRSCHPGRE